MYPVWLLCVSNLKKRKAQNLIIALIIMLSTLLLSTAAVVMSSTGDVFSSVHKRVNGSHEILKFENGLQNPDKVHAWWKSQQGVLTSALYRYHSLTVFTHQGNEVANINLNMMNTQPEGTAVDKLIFAKGTKKVVPPPGTIWVPTSLAYSKNFSVGDTLGFKTGNGNVNLKISAVVVDVPFGQPFTITARIWMNPADYNHYMSVSGSGQSEKSMMSLRFNNLEEEGLYWGRFEQAFGTPFLESLTDFGSITSFYLLINQLIGFIMIFLAIVMILIALYTIGFTISDAILSNYKTIGILKSSGLSSSRMILVYVVQYAFLSVIAVIPGILLSYILSHQIISMSLAYLKTEHNTLKIEFAGTAMGVGLAVLLLIVLISFIFARRSRKVLPAQAIRYGMSEAQNLKMADRLHAPGKSRFGFARLPVVIVLGIRSIVKDWRGSTLMTMIAALTTSVLVFGFIFLYSIASMNPPEWGYDNSDVSMEVVDSSAVSVDHLRETLQQDDRIRSMSGIGEVYGIVSRQGNESNGRLGLNLMTADGNINELGYSNVEGSNPARSNQISLGVKAADVLGKKVGDTVEIYVQGRKGTFVVSGIYQAITNMSMSGRLTNSAVEQLQLQEVPKPKMFLINLHSGVSPDSFIEDLRTQYGKSLFVAKQETLIKEVMSQAVTILILPMSLVGIFFLAIAFGITFSISRMKLKHDSKAYGIYRSLGMTSRQIRVSILLSTLILAAIGTAAGFLMGTFILPGLLNLVLGSYGIVHFPINLNGLGLTSVVPVSLLSIGVSAWLASRMIKRSSLRVLVQD